MRSSGLTNIVQGWPKFWGNFKALIGIFSQIVGPSLTIWANPEQILLYRLTVRRPLWLSGSYHPQVLSGYILYSGNGMQSDPTQNRVTSVFFAGFVTFSRPMFYPSLLSLRLA